MNCGGGFNRIFTGREIDVFPDENCVAIIGLRAGRLREFTAPAVVQIRNFAPAHGHGEASQGHGKMIPTGKQTIKFYKLADKNQWLFIFRTLNE